MDAKNIIHARADGLRRPQMAFQRAPINGVLLFGRHRRRRRR